MRFLLVRHGETEYNREGRIQGQSDIPLSEAGREQVRSLGVRLAGLRIDAAFSSDLGRAVETARTILGERKLELKLTPDLRELAYGDWEGALESEIASRDPDLFRKWHCGDPGFAPPGGESFRELIVRGEAFVKYVRSGLDEESTVLVAGHGGSVRAVAFALLDVSVDMFTRMTVSRASLSIIDSFPEGGVLCLWNSVSHYE